MPFWKLLSAWGTACWSTGLIRPSTSTAPCSASPLMSSAASASIMTSEQRKTSQALGLQIAGPSKKVHLIASP